MGSNTGCFNARVNRIARSRGTAAHRAGSSRIRGPTHGCQGSASSQRQLGGSPTQVLCQADLQSLNRAGELSQLQAEVAAMPDVVIQQTFGADMHNFDMPMGCDYADSRPFVGVGEDDGDSDWELEDEVEELKEQMREAAGCRKHREDYQTRCNRTDHQWKHWDAQKEAMLGSYMAWSLHEKEGVAPEACVQESEVGVTVIDLFGTEYRLIPQYEGDVWQSQSLIHAGLLPTAPLAHTYAVTIRTMQFYHTLFCRCPKIGVQPFAKTLCDLAGQAFKPFMSAQLSTAFDIYCCILQGYRLKEDLPLEMRMIVEMDSNDSLRRVEHQGDASLEPSKDGEEEGAPRLGPLKERIDHRVGGGDYFLSKQEVDVWDRNSWEDGPPEEQPQSQTKPKMPLEMLWEEGRCEEQWNNMKERNTACSVGRFYEWGWFVLLCRHMFLLVACDMIQSGEQKISFGMGRENQLGNLDAPMTAAVSWGKPSIEARSKSIEDGEGCERYFSIMNALAGVTRHMSVFHRRQAIAEVAYAHNNLEAYANLSHFIFNNYRQALEILATQTSLSRSMVQAGIRAENFFDWLEEEGNYLQSLTKTLPSETLEMEYVLKLESLDACQSRLEKVHQVWKEYQPSSINEAAATRSLETKHRNEQENERKLIADAQALEHKLGLQLRWKQGSKEWEAAKKLVKEREYRKALDKLEGLLVARIFEMTRLNVAGTGYKMCKHLGNALKARSKSIQSAIEVYNAAACSLSPPRQQLSWDQILESSFLSEFDILRDACDDVREKKWATQKNCLLMQQFFKLLSEETELTRLHTEIRRLITYMEDEDARIEAAAQRQGESDPALALQICLHGKMRSRFNGLHRQRFQAITKLEGFQQESMVHFRRGTSVVVDEWAMDTAEGIDFGIHGGSKDDEDIDPDLLYAEDEASIEDKKYKIV
ncbi:hypothetical protein BT96DRAFT_949735 [Gymnopus androsaceus JB14]|uniref:CxC1-like cysteine cluster associated with KDZ transposases domain-containing protein n=1 Tax=Gymnopus androsaceus JB14 TaxID=1447944 RepID=A0A6A4GJK4_9AGAR|nr:hypothetical protein BT96DRAFT_949735 [Gymnopus androsaceus JB14]